MGSKKREIPVYQHPIIETHCHLDYLKQQSVEELIELATSKNIEKIVTISVTPDNLDDALKLSNDHELVYCTQGIHPHDARLWNKNVEAQIRNNLKNSSKVVAIGEIGLDFHYNHSKKDEQIDAFSQQIGLAIEYDLPVVIHSRDADEETIDILKKYQSKMKRKGVIHSFTSGIELAKQALDWGFYLGFNGIITFNSAENVRDVLKITPLDKVLLETDAPFLTPVPYRGRENAPHFLPFIAEKVAEVKNLPIDQVLETTYQNSLQLFDLTYKS